MIRNRLVSRKRASTRYQPPIAPALVGLALVGLFVSGAVAFGRAQGVFLGVIERSSAAGDAVSTPEDGTRRAVVEEGEVLASVEVTVTGGRVESITLLDGRNVDPTVAQTIFASVRDAQSTAVDAVTGATATSQVLLRAIDRALE